MINLFWKMAFIIMTINGFFFFMGGCALSGQYGNHWSWIPQSLTASFSGGGCQTSSIDKISDSSNIQPSNTFQPTDSNDEISAGSTSTSKVVPNLLTFMSATSFIYDLLFNIMFGYFIWLQLLLPMPIVIALCIPLFFIQLFGLWYLLSGFLNAIGIALGFLR